MKHYSIMIKPASSLCNLRCKYCFYADVSNSRTVRSYGVIGEQTVKQIVDTVFLELRDGDHLSIAFQGGEPTVAGLDIFQFFVACVREKRKSVQVQLDYALQTNGTLLTEKWCHFLKANNFLVGLSLDGPALFHDRHRVDERQQGTYKMAMKAKQLLERYDIPYNVLCVLTNENARHPQKLWSFFLENGLRFVQIIPCLDDLDATTQPWALTPERFFSFYSALFPLWHREVQDGNYISVKLFDDIANLLVYKQATGCGMNGHCNLQYIVESDGSVFPCDFYVLDEYRLGNLCTDTFSKIQMAYYANGFANSRDSLPGNCAACPYRVLCGGGCKRMAKNMYFYASGCALRDLIDEIGPVLWADALRLARI